MKCNSSVNQNLKHKKGLWSPDEDKTLRDYIVNHGLGCWSSVPINAGLQRNGKSCRLRWTNYLRPGLRRGMFTADEEQKILTLHAILGNKWSQMSRHLPGRSDNEIKNHWHSYLKKKLAKLENVKSQTISLDTSNKETSSASSLKSSASTEGLSADAEPLDYSKKVGSKIVPKILFTEWLSLDSDDLSVSGDALHHFSRSQETIINEESYHSDIQEVSIVSNPQFSPELDVDINFYDLIFEEHVCPNFNYINDLTVYSCNDLYSASTSSESNSV